MKLSELMGVKSHLQHRPERHRVEDVLMSRGFRKMGSGGFGSVWEVPGKPYVLKLFDVDDTAYQEFVTMAQRSNFNPHFPMFRGSPIPLTPQVRAIRMERLKPLNINWASALQRGIGVILEAIPLGSNWQEDAQEDFNDRELRDMQLALRKWPRLAEAAQMLIDLYNLSDRAEWDLHQQNVMLRGSTPVFTDPFAV